MALAVAEPQAGVLRYVPSRGGNYTRQGRKKDFQGGYF